MIIANPDTENINLSKNQETGKLRLSYPAHSLFVSDNSYVPYDVKETDKSAFLNITPINKEADNSFLEYLTDVDARLTDLIDKYNAKFNAELKYVPCLKNPMKKTEDGELVVNEEALEKYGQSMDIRAVKGKDKYRVLLEHEDIKLRNPHVLDFENYVQAGARVVCVMRPSLWHKDDNTVQLMPTLLRIKVKQSAAETIDLDHDLTGSDNTNKNPYELLEL